MRFLHTSDWHLGRIFHGLHMTDDQAIVLEELIALVKESNVDAVLIAGDIYDRAVPPTQAVTLLDEVLRRLVQEAGKNVIMIAGNHDNADRLGFGQSRYLRTSFISPVQSALLPSPLYYLIPTGPLFCTADLWRAPGSCRTAPAAFKNTRRCCSLADKQPIKTDPRYSA